MVVVVVVVVAMVMIMVMIVMVVMIMMVIVPTIQSRRNSLLHLQKGATTTGICSNRAIFLNCYFLQMRMTYS
jgi:hypothetical protein